MSASREWTWKALEGCGSLGSFIKTNYENKLRITNILDDKSPITDSSQNKQYEINSTVQKKNIPRQNQKFVSENMSKQMKLAFCIGNLYIFSISKRMCLQ